MANYIPYDSGSAFRWYEGNDPDRYTLVNSQTLNIVIDEHVKNAEKLDKTIADVLDGNIKATKLATTDIEISNQLKLNKTIVSSVNNKVSFVTDENKDEVILDAYKGSFGILTVGDGEVSYDNKFNFKSNGNFADVKARQGIFDTLSLGGNSILKTIIDSDEDVEYLDFKAGDDYSKSFLRTGGMYLLNNYLNFSSKDLSDAIVYDDSNSGDTQNSYLFYADGKVSKSTLQAGNFKTVGADLAEYYELDYDNYEAGTVIGIGTDSEGTKFKKGMKVLGVVSENAGHIMNSENDFKYAGLIGLKGRVVVELIGSAERGDYLIAEDDGACVAKKDYTFEESKNLVGIALEDGQDFVLAKI